MEKEMATHSSILAWRIPWQRNLVGYSPWSHKDSATTENINTQHIHVHIHVLQLHLGAEIVKECLTCKPSKGKLNYKY